MATVWLARDTRLARPVALKLPSRELSADSTFGRRFEREAQTAASLSHPNLVPVFDYGSENGRPYLVSEFIDGANLAELRAEGKAPATEDVAQALLEALDGIHAAGIVHRDIKAGNVLVDRSGRIMLTDFGIAQSREATQLTSEGMVIGTAHYTAPEVRRGGRATPASDLYSCGVLLADQLKPEDPDRVSRLVGELTRDDPEERVASAADALDLLEHRPVEIPTDELRAERTPRDVLEESSLPAPPPPPIRKPRSFPEPPSSGEPRRRRNFAFPIGIAAGLLLVGAIVAAALALGGNEEDSPDGRDKPRVVTRSTEVTETETTTEAAAEEPPPEEDPAAGTQVADGGDDPALGTQLNDEGYALLQAGDAAGALPKLEAAVAAFPEDSTDINYAYALFNYAQALRLTGDPSSAIPLLEKRLAISDEQVPAVQAELAEAQAAAGGKPPKKPKKPKPPKP